MTITKQALKNYISTNYKYKHQRRESIACWLVRVLCNRTGYSIKTQLEDISSHGCSSGCVSEVIYTYDCVNIYRKYEKSIWDMVEEFRDSTGQTLGEFIDSFFSKVEDEDTMKVYFCWFAIEQTAYQLLSHFES